jgi:hypothetical protein
MAISKRHQRILQKHADELVEHFNTPGHGWPLVADVPEANLLLDLLGFDPLDELVKLARVEAKIGHVFTLDVVFSRTIAKIPKSGKKIPSFRADGVPVLFEDVDEKLQKIRISKMKKKMKAARRK